MKTFKIPVQYIFSGTVEVKAHTVEEAQRAAIMDVGFVIGGKIHASNPNVVDWDFCSHPEKKIADSE